MSDTAAATFRTTCDATHTVVVCKPWVHLCRTSRTNGLTEAIVLGKAIAMMRWAEDRDAGVVDDEGRLWTFITETQWENDCFLSPSQVYRALEKLEALGFVAQVKMQRQRGGHPVRHVTVFGEAIGDALEALERGEWDPEATLRTVTSSRGRGEVSREDATDSAGNASRAREQVVEVGREDATSVSRARDEASRNKEELPTATTYDPSTTHESPTVAASDDGPPDEPVVASLRQLTPQQILFATIAQAFGWDPRCNDLDQHKQVTACAGKLGKRSVTAADIDEVRAIAWFARGTEPKITPAALGERWGRFRGDADAAVLAQRDAAADIVAAGSVALSRPLVGTDGPEAEYAVAVLLARGKSVGLVKRALQRQGTDSWSLKYLEHAATQIEKEVGGGRGRGVPTIVPDDLTALVDGQLVDLMKSNPTFEDLARVFTEITARLEHVDGQVERIAGFRRLLGGKDGWPRGGGGHVNEARFKLAAWCEDWLSVNAASTPALMRGA